MHRQFRLKELLVIGFFQPTLEKNGLLPPYRSFLLLFSRLKIQKNMKIATIEVYLMGVMSPMHRVRSKQGRDCKGWADQ